MNDFPSSPGIDPPSPTLSARLRETADYLSAPTAGRLTEEQRALTLGIARRLILDVAMRIDVSIDFEPVWNKWLQRGLPGAARLADLCFARAEEHRWRGLSALRASPPPILVDTGTEDAKSVGADAPLSDRDRAFLSLRIADRRRFDAMGHPAIAIADLDPPVFRALLLEIAAQLVADSIEDHQSEHLSDTVRTALGQQANETGLAQAGVAYHDILGAALPDAAATAIARYDWATLIALAAAAHRRSYHAMTLALLAAESAALPSLLAPLRLDRAALAPLEASLAMLPSRPVHGIDDFLSSDAAGNAA